MIDGVIESMSDFSVEFVSSVDVGLMIGEVEEIGLWVLTQTTCLELMLET